MNFDDFNYSQIRDLLLHRQITCQQIIERYLKKINEGKNLNAFISILGQQALAAAKNIDSKLEKSRAGKLAGMVLAVKDNINLKGQKTTCGSKMLADFVSPYTATVLQRLEQEDAIIIGKTNMDEFAIGSSNETSYFNPVKNPHDITKVPGGSSGGSAVSVAASMSMAALGSDTGGSIRQPAAFCGVVGMKPTYGSVSRFGLVAFASSFDQIGPLTKSVEDAARILEVIAGADPQDSTTFNLPVVKYSEKLNLPIKGLRIGLPVEFFGAGLNKEIKHKILTAVDLLKHHGAAICKMSLPHTTYSIAAYYIIANAEASSNLARYNGTHFGFRARRFTDLETMIRDSRDEGFGEEVKRRIMLGTYVLSAGYYENFYKKAQQVRWLIRKDFERAFESFDCLLTPTVPTTAFKMGEKMQHPLAMYLSDVYTVSANLSGIPALSLPCGVDAENMPIGLQIMAKQFNEEIIFRLAFKLEKLLQS